VRGFKTLLAGAALAFGVAGAASAAIPVYPTPGVENGLTYTFTAASTGNIVAYFATVPVTASYTEELGLLINGVDSGVVGLSNHSTTAGTSLNFGGVTAGDSLVFYIKITAPPLPAADTIWYSKKSMNTDGAEHIWSTHYTGGDVEPGGTLPAGTLVAFEDLPKSHSDFNYHDEVFVFTNVGSKTGGIPEPMTWSLMILGFGATGAMLRRSRQLARTA
jgi:hypothetical protein